MLSAAAAAVLLAAPAQAAPGLDTPEAVQREMQAIFKQGDRMSDKAFDVRVQALIAAPGFAQIDEHSRCVGYWLAGIGRGGLNDWTGADGDYAKASVCTDMSADFWKATFDAALRADDPEMSARGLQMLAERWPKELSGFNDGAVFQTLSGAWKLPKAGERRFALLDVLFDIGWKPTDPTARPDQKWAELAAALADRGLTIRAGRVVEQISDPRILAIIRADKRFDDLYDHEAPRFDPEAAFPVNLGLRRKQAAEHPDGLGYAIDYAKGLILGRQPEAALKLLDEAQARIDRADSKVPAPYSDLAEQGVWLKDYRRRALSELGRAEEALALEVAASKEKENGGDNVSQLINLAGIYAKAGRPQEALAVLAQLKSDVSDYGRMQVEKIKVIAAVQTGDKAALAASLAYMKAHESAAPGSLVVALLAAGDLDAVARCYVERLNDPDRRLEALSAFQDFAPPLHQSAFDRRIDEQMLAIRTRPDVKAAIDAVGRIGRYSFRGDLN